MSERWKDIPGYEGLYQVSDLGRVKRLKKWDVNLRGYKDNEMVMVPTDNGNGYMIVALSRKGARKNYYVHRLVAEAFVSRGRPDQGCINHIDHNRKNNSASNLEWCTPGENVRHSAHLMRHPKSTVRTNTGERYICYRASRSRYRLIINGRELGTFRTLEEAVNARDRFAKGVI